MANSTLPYVGACSCLIVEDQVLIALDLESMLLESGATRVAIANTIEQAAKLIESDTFQAVFLDVQIGDATTISLAIKLREKSVPVIFSTGSDIKSTLPEEFHDHATLHKPYNEFEVRKAVERLLRQD